MTDRHEAALRAALAERDRLRHLWPHPQVFTTNHVVTRIVEAALAAEPSVPAAQLRAVIALIGDEDMTPTARRMLESVCGEQVKA